MGDLLTKRDINNKRGGDINNKRGGDINNKRGGDINNKRELMKETYSNAGADGDYTVTLPDGDTITIQGAIAVKVLAHGELNLVTDTGRWYLFAPNAWRSASPNQPEPGNSGD